MTLIMDISTKRSDAVKLTKPTLIGTFRTELTKESKIINDQNYNIIYKSRYVINQIDLEKGFTEYMKINKSFNIQNKFDSLINWLKTSFNTNVMNNSMGNSMVLNYSDDYQTNNLNTDFVCTNATLSYLLKCGYELENYFSIIAERFNGTIYIKIRKHYHNDFDTFNYNLQTYCELSLRKKFTEKDVSSGESKLSGWKSFGRKENEGFEEKINYVLRIKLNKHRILFSEEIDALDQDNTKNKLNNVKFKLTKIPRMVNGYYDALKKMRWWSSCVFSSTRKIIIGYYQNNHIVEKAKEFRLENLDCPEYYSQEACLNNLDAILTFIKNSFDKLNTNTICLIHNPNSKELICTESNQKLLPFFYKI